MNKRQKKKLYKKIHGHNPTSLRHLKKEADEILRDIPLDVADTKQIFKAMKVLVDAVCKVFSLLQKWLGEFIKKFK